MGESHGNARPGDKLHDRFYKAWMFWSWSDLGYFTSVELENHSLFPDSALL